MYRKYYGLERKPFELSPDPNTVFLSESHKEALSILRYGVISRKGFLLLTGDVGTGKTTLLEVLAKALGSRVHLCFMTNPALSTNEFYYFLSEQFDLGQYKGNKALFLRLFANFLKICRRRNERVLLVVDEAHVVSVDLYEEIRLLSNQEFDTYGILSIFLVGQPELNRRLGHPNLLPLRQRIALRFNLQPFNITETENYVRFRLQRAGAQRLDLFSGEALRLIHEVTRGTPRLINIVCDYALLGGFSQGKPQIDEELVRECVNDLHIPGEKTLLPLPPKKQPWWKRAGN